MNSCSLTLALIGSVLVVGRVFSQSPLVPLAHKPAGVMHNAAPPPMTDFERTGQTLDGFGWTQQPWTGNDVPYQAIRANIDRALARGTNPQKLIATYKAKEEYDSQNPLAVFGWAYARYQSTQVPQINFNPSLWDVPGELGQVPQPHTYNFVRLRFLTEAQGRDTGPLRGIGERLLRQDPADNDVALFLVRVLRPLQTPASNAEAKEITQALIARSPQVPLYHQLLANVYQDIYMSEGHKPQDAELAIASLQDFLRLAPANDPYRQGCEEVIPLLRRGEAMDWTPARTRSTRAGTGADAPPEALKPPLPAFKYPTASGQPLPPVPLK